MHVVMLVKSDVVGDARVRKEAATLVGAGYRVTIVGDGVPEGVTTVEGADVLSARPPRSPGGRGGRSGVLRRLGRWLLLPEHRARQERAFGDAAEAVARRGDRPDVVHAHDLSALPPAVSLARRAGARLVYDAHECWTGRRLEGRPTPVGRLVARRRERALGATADAVVTVSDELAAWFRAEHGWDHVRVVRNSFPWDGADPRPVSPPRGVLYAGRVDAKRDLATLVDAARAGLPGGLGAWIVGPQDASFVERLDAGPVSVRAAVAIDDVDALYRDAGIALVPLTDDSLNHRVALPNKLFQAVRAGVPVVAADLPAIRRVVTEHGLGALYRPGDPASLVQALERVAQDHPATVARVAAARPELTWGRDEARLLEVYARLTEEP